MRKLDRYFNGDEVKIGVVMPILNQQTLALEAYASMKSRFGLEFFPINNWQHGFSVAKSWNVGILKALNKGCGLILVANDDIVLAKHTIDLMTMEMFKNPKAALITGRDYRDEVFVKDIYNFRPSTEEHGEHTDYALFMIRPSAYTEIGAFDKTFEPAYFEDNDYHRRISIHEHWETYQLKSAAFYHYGSTTQFSEPGYPKCPSQQFEKNKAYYIKKWGGVPGQEAYPVPFGGQIIGVSI